MPSLAMNIGFDSQPFESRRSPVMAANGVVCTSQPLAARAGVQMLEAGGSAVDAAIATAAALTVLEPTSNGLGSDAFMIMWDGEQIVGANASGRWPKASSAAALRERGFDKIPDNGWASVTVPGCVQLWGDLHERYGKLEFARLLEPAIGYAQGGYPVSPVIAELWRRTYARIGVDTDPAVAGWREIFAPGGKTPAAGTCFAAPAMARTLRNIADRGVRDFYEGEIAEGIIAYARETGADLALDDLSAHRTDWVEPISARYGDVDIWEIPPNGQGIAALVALGILDGTDLHQRASMDADAWHMEIEAMKLAFADTYRYVADPQCAAVPTRGLLEPAYLAQRRQLLTDSAQLAKPGEPDFGTVYLCAADRDGMMVSFIQSNYKGFGSGVVVPAWGISFQDRAAGFVLEEGHPNVAAPGKRPRHTIIPAFLTRNGEPLGPFGVMGGEMQPQGHLQVVRSIVDHGLNPQAALDCPRWKWDQGLDVSLEPQVPEAMAKALAGRGHKIVRSADSLLFGRGQIILRLDSGAYIAGSEPRADGAAVGY